MQGKNITLGHCLPMKLNVTFHCVHGTVITPWGESLHTKNFTLFEHIVR